MRTEHLPSISQEIQPSTAMVVLSRIALQFARDEDMGPVTALPITVFQLIWVIGQAYVQLSLADRSRNRFVWGGNAATTLRRTEAVFIGKQQKLVDVAAKELQHPCLFAILWPFQPADIFFEQRLFRIFAALEHGRRHAMKLRNLPKERGKNVRVVNPEIVLHFAFEYRVYILP